MTLAEDSIWICVKFSDKIDSQPTNARLTGVLKFESGALGQLGKLGGKESTTETDSVSEATAPVLG